MSVRLLIMVHRNLPRILNLQLIFLILVLVGCLSPVVIKVLPWEHFLAPVRHVMIRDAMMAKAVMIRKLLLKKVRQLR